MRMVSWLWKGSNDEENQDELKKKGFDPEALEVQAVKEEAITDFSKDYQGFICPKAEQILQMVQSYKPFNSQDEHRHELAHPKGGRNCADKKQVSKVRAIGKEMIVLIGKKIISGDFNLTKVSFPIKAMVPKSALENCTFGCCMFPVLITKASQIEQPLERMKLFITATISSFYYMNLFLKPLNPILGETLQASYPDGTQIYAQQISHHPPISYILVIGPKNSYRYYGHYHYEAKAGLNSMTLTNKGYRVLEFPDGQKIKGTFSKDTFSGVFLGTMRSQVIGQLEFIDEKNDLKGVITFGKVKGKPSDYFSGKITQKNKAVSQMTGSYLGFLNIDDQRYWDGRQLNPFKIEFAEETLESDHSRRTDLKKLKDGKISEAQIEKQRLEDLQRNDAKLRKSRH